MDKILTKVPFIDQVLKGLGQIMLQENSSTGLLFLIGIFLGSIEGGIGAIVSTAVGTITAILLKYNKEEINAGLYGFSAALVGVALTIMFDSTFLIWILLVVASALAAIIQHFFIKRNIPVFTLPFILLTWCLIFGIHHFTTIGPATAGNTITLLETNDLFTSTNGFGEVIFQGGPMSGIIFFIAVFIGSPAAALYGLAASIFSAEISNLFGEPVEQIHMGLFGFNAVLTAIVFAGTKRIDGFWVLLGVFITVLIDVLFVKINIFASFGGVLTFPFVVGTWCTLFIKKYTDRFFGV
ncbi:MULTISPECIES: urea transporter [Empedobacter]|uniref:Urea transporter n=1 Tax=Empedobacter falsenii TaxID=343874 RepID=A0A7H9DRB9_9FLAO|nr:MULTISPECIES: urea transporter [Empedobacter]MDH0659535.1 urea transporter [Empedobacter sp. GD03865]MDH0674457.1 urea transporter [Empedobacter sp. GD03861]QLL57708.1 urea transporter [Empedobacter falsenii]